MNPLFITLLLLQTTLIVGLGYYIYDSTRRLAKSAAAENTVKNQKNPDAEQIQHLLTMASRTLDEHAGELGRFSESLGAHSTKANARNVDLEKLLKKMHQANHEVEKSIDSTVAELTDACGEMLADEKSNLEAYRTKTEAFDTTLSGVDNHNLLAVITSKLVDMVHELREENNSVRSRLEDAKDEVIELMARAHSAEQMARTDSLTKLPNRRVFEEALTEQHDAFERAGTHYAIVLMDLDYFKTVNDRYGHPVGDAVLAMVGQIFADGRRTDDYLCRMGGEEFAVLLTNCNLETAMRVADRYRQKIEVASLRTDARQVSVTISCGVAVVQANERKNDVLKRADLALYHAKSEGRNRVSADYGEKNDTANAASGGTSGWSGNSTNELVGSGSAS